LFADLRRCSLQRIRRLHGQGARSVERLRLSRSIVFMRTAHARGHTGEPAPYDAVRTDPVPSTLGAWRTTRRTRGIVIMQHAARGFHAPALRRGGRSKAAPP
jgi:hypothetical protein